MNDQPTLRDVLKLIPRAILGRYYNPADVRLYTISLGFLALSGYALYIGVENALAGVGVSISFLIAILMLSYHREQRWRAPENRKPTLSDIELGREESENERRTPNSPDEWP